MFRYILQELKKINLKKHEVKRVQQSCLGEDCWELFILDLVPITIISDSHKGLIDAVNDWLPEAEHIKSSCTLEQQFQQIIDQIKLLDANAYHYLIQRNLNSWSRAFFEMDRRCAAFVIGISKSFNKAILGLRQKPIITMLEEIREWIVFPSGFQELKVRKGDQSYGVNLQYKKRTNDVPPLPPIIRKMPDKPQKARIKAPGETSGSQVSSVGRTMKWQYVSRGDGRSGRVNGNDGSGTSVNDGIDSGVNDGSGRGVNDGSGSGGRGGGRAGGRGKRGGGRAGIGGGMGGSSSFGILTAEEGLARSMPTSGALDRVAEKLNLPFFEMRKRSTQNELATVNTVEIAKKNYLVSFVFDSLIKNYEVAASSVGDELFYHVVVQGALADAFVRENDLVVNAHGMAALVQLQTTLTLILLSTTDKMGRAGRLYEGCHTYSELGLALLVDPAASKKKHVDSTSKSSKYMVILRLKQLIFSFKHYMRAAKYDLPTKMSGQEQYQVCAYKDGEVIIDTAAGVLRKYDPRPEKNHSFGKRVQNSVTLKDVASGNGVSHLSQPSMSQNKIGHSNNKALKRLRAHDLLMINKHVADSLLGYTKIELASMW
ncbi:hypothetical protein Tco_0401705 [Tanacetum coccineum]